MPRYDYFCRTCAANLSVKLKRPLTDEELDNCVFETQHTFFPSAEELKKATECPDCNGNNVMRIINVSGQSVFVRGHNWEEFKRENKAALQRDMALHQLEHNDPYGYMREGDDKAELTEKLKSGAKKQTKPQYFT